MADHAHAGHDHSGHDHKGHHHHGPTLASVDAPRWLWVALGMNLAIMVVEIIVGLIANSTALLTDAAHVVTDALAIGLALAAITVARRPAKGGYTYGFGRVEILSAQLNGTLLLALGAILGVGSFLRLLDPPQVDGSLVIVASIFGLVGNGAAAWALTRASRRSMAVEGAFQHALLDAIASVAAIIAGVVIVAGGPDAADPLLALLVTALMLRSGWQVLGSSLRVLLERAPSDTNPDEVYAALKEHVGVVAVRDLHVWVVTDGFPAVTAHIEVAVGDDCHARRAELQTLMHEQFSIDHVTFQVDHTGTHSGNPCQNGHGNARLQ